MAPLLASLKSVGDVGVQKQIIGEVTNALSRQAKAKMPAEWPAVYAKLAQSNDASLRDQALAISVKFGDSSIFPTLRSIASNKQASIQSRQSALAALISGKDDGLLPLLKDLLNWLLKQRMKIIRA